MHQAPTSAGHAGFGTHAHDADTLRFLTHKGSTMQLHLLCHITMLSSWDRLASCKVWAAPEPLALLQQCDLMGPVNTVLTQLSKQMHGI
jgi:hypothetical protein